MFEAGSEVFLARRAAGRQEGAADYHPSAAVPIETGAGKSRREAMHLLVVCTANIARSPLAEAMLAERLAADGVEVASAGTRAHVGDPAADGARALAAERGLDLSSHRSRPVTCELVADADMVLAMEERQRDACATLSPGSAGKVFALRELVRLIDGVDVVDSPVEPAARLEWLCDRAHLARPRAWPSQGREDVTDPIGRPWPAWAAMGRDLDRLVERLVTAVRTR